MFEIPARRRALSQPLSRNTAQVLEAANPIRIDAATGGGDTMERVTLFYSWQSDRDSRLCRGFLERALEQASDVLRQESIELLVDSDTKGMPGTPPLSATILRKIREADAFLADMTLVAQTSGGKLAPNPNVLVEYGYALHDKGHERIVLTMNTAFGGPDSLPFDLRHLRHPLAYNAPEEILDGERRQVRSALASKLAGAIRMVVKNLREQRAETAVSDLDQRQAAHDLMIQRANAFFGGDVPALVSRPRLVMHGVPLAALEARALPASRVGPVVENFIPPSFERVYAGSSSQYW